MQILECSLFHSLTNNDTSSSLRVIISSSILYTVQPSNCSALHVGQEVLESSPCLLTTRQDLVGREDETVVTSIPQLNSHAVCSLGTLVSIVNTVAADLVDSVANWATGESGSVNGLDSGDSAIGERCILGVVGDGGGAGVAVWVHPLDILLAGNSSPRLR